MRERPSLIAGLRREPTMHNKVIGISQKWNNMGAPRYQLKEESNESDSLSGSISNSNIDKPLTEMAFSEKM